jgi:hypothetical protein
MAARDPRAWLDALHDLRTRFGGDAAAAKLAHLKRQPRPAFANADDLVAYHDALLFMRAYPDDAAVLAAVERRLRGFRSDVARYVRVSGDTARLALADSGLVDSVVSHVYSFRLARALAARLGRALEIDWDTYQASDTANIPVALVPAMLWHESDALDNDDDFDERAWLERNRTRTAPTCLAALLTLFATSGLPESVQEHLYDQAEIPVRWDLTRSRSSRTWKRARGPRTFLQAEPLRGRSRDLRASIAVRPPRLQLLPAADSRRYVADVHDVLASRVRELYPLAGANPAEVYRYDAGRGLRLIIFGSVPAIRLPHESNFGALFVRNDIPIGYGLGAMVFARGEMAINIFPAYRSGESAFLIEEFFRLFVHHFGARTLVISSYQVGDGNDEGLDSGAFWFYYKLGFRPVKPLVRALAERQAARAAADPGYRSSRAMLKRLSRSDMFFDLDPARMKTFDALPLAQLGYAVTRHVVRAYEGDRRAAVDRSLQRIARIVPIGDPRQLPADQLLGARRLAPLIDAIDELTRWPYKDRRRLAKLLRSKSGTHEKRFVSQCQQLPRLETALRRLATREFQQWRRIP